jgi:large subunit ribosomal protein L4
MATLQKYTIQGKAAGKVEISDKIANAEVHGQMLKDYVVAIRNNMRQWSASTKGRSEVNHTTKKPYRQKGTGNARQGSFVAPQFRGGGIVFGPKPKFDQHVRINKKERQAAIRFLLGEKVRNEKVIVIDDPKMKEPKTKTVASFLKNKKVDRNVLVLTGGKYAEVPTEGKNLQVSVRTDEDESFIKSLRNLQKVEFSLAKNICGYTVMKAHHIILTESALQEINQWLGE